MKTLAFYNHKGGVGKTTTAVNVAHLAAAEGNRVLLWDLDPQGAATFLLRAESAAVATPEKVLRKGTQLQQFVRASDYPGLDVLTAGAPSRHFDIALSKVKKSKSRLARRVLTFRDTYDYVVLDCPPSMSLLARNVTRAADLVLMPLIPTPLSLRGLEQYYSGSGRGQANRRRVLPFFCQVDRRKRVHREIVAMPPIPAPFLQSEIPYLAAVERMSTVRAPLTAVAPRSRGAAAYRALWNEIKIQLRWHGPADVSARS